MTKPERMSKAALATLSIDIFDLLPDEILDGDLLSVVGNVFTAYSWTGEQVLSMAMVLAPQMAEANAANAAPDAEAEA